VFIIHKTTSELETRDLVDPIICRCRKHQQLAHQEGGFVSCFPLNVLMVHSPKYIIIANGKSLASVGFALGKIICFGSLEFIANRFGDLSLSPEGNCSSAVFVGMVHIGSQSLHTVFEESTDEDDIASSGRGNTSFSIR
jgi:hypothetical protein